MSPIRITAAALVFALLAPVAAAKEASAQHSKEGFITFVEDGRLWVFKVGSQEAEDFKAHGEPTKMATKVGAGPGGMTVKSADLETLDAYLTAP
ncbi:hypothetical protein C3942_17005 [Solimonas fluminis]|jgi:hypothetical protein|uniref:Uncharacterized protein n=1 Tax=Solimonas fluminis TaxID=2086571 RepID=A0A2S5TD36_9GAMM|nr:MULTISPECIES: hypothetical protein [Solimonas]MDM4771370.1 hypothetical protein [Solimonas sp. SE-A11]PPE72748.1 hypothetical protein C3942_17005 [Solimonas fluminis]